MPFAAHLLSARDDAVVGGGFTIPLQLGERRRHLLQHCRVTASTVTAIGCHVIPPVRAYGQQIRPA